MEEFGTDSEEVIFMYKKGIRILAVDDGPLDKSGKGVLVVGIVGREGTIEGVLSFRVDADGSDATERLSATIQKTRFRDQIKLIALNGVTLAGPDVDRFFTIIQKVSYTNNRSN